jgi:hypothetical protein
VQNEPAELQILKQTLGAELGTMVYGLNLMASSCAQMAQQVQQQAEKIQQLEAVVPSSESPTENAWTTPPEGP